MKNYSNCIHFVTVAATSVALVACQETLDTARIEAVSENTLGQEVFKVLCEREASAANPSDVGGYESSALCAGAAEPSAATSPRLRALAENREPLVQAVDFTIPDETHEDFNQLLNDIIPLNDEGILSDNTRELAARLGTLAANPKVTFALGRFSSRVGYRPMHRALGATRAALSYPDIDQVLLQTVAALDVGGVAHDDWRAALRGAAYEFATLEPPDPAERPSTAAIVRDLMLRTDPAFAGTSPALVVRRDARGFALPTVVAGGFVPSPFVDRDGDGLPDVNNAGQFLDDTGGVLSLPTPFRTEHEQGVIRDEQGRALQPDSSVVWQYFDADSTLLAGLLRESAPWLRVKTPTLLDVAHAAPAVLGPRTMQRESYGAASLEYQGFDTAHGPLFDVIHGAAQVFPTQAAVDVLQTTEILLSEHEDVAAGVIGAALGADRRADVYSTLRLPENNIFWDELLDVLRIGAEREGLIEAVMRSLSNEESEDLEEMIAIFMSHKDLITFDPSNFNKPIPAGRLSVPVDRKEHDTAMNESLMQRALSLLHDMNEVEFCSKDGADLGGAVGYALTGRVPDMSLSHYDECGIFKISNAAEAYIKAAIGEYELEVTDTALADLIRLGNSIGNSNGNSLIDLILQATTGVEGMTTHPTPQALARVVFAPHNPGLQLLVGELRDANGISVEDRHCIGRETGNREEPCNSVIFALEKPIPLSSGRTRTFLQVMAPLWRALYEHEERGAFLFGDLAAVMHRSYPSVNDQYGIRDYEPLIVEILQEEHLLRRLRTAVLALDRIDIRPGPEEVDGIQALANAAQIMLDPRRSCVGSCDTGSLRYRDGRDFICWNDGQCWNGQERPLIHPSPLYLVLDGLRGIDDAWLAEPDRHTRWLTARSRIVDQLLSVQNTPAERLFANQRGRALALAVLSVLRERIEAHRAEGDGAARAWAAERATDAEDVIGSPLGAALIDLVDHIQANVEARDTLLAFLSHMVNETPTHEEFEGVLVSAIDVIQMLDDSETLIPVINALAALFAPNVEEVLSHGGELQIDTSLVYRSIDLLHRVSDADDARVLRRILANAVSPLPSPTASVTPMERLGDVIAEVNRNAPGQDGPLTAADWELVMKQTQEFLVNDERGLERLFDIIRERELVH